MKRLGIIMLAAWISAALLAGCEKHAADAPDFPLEKQAIEEALETMGLQYTVEEDSKLREMLPDLPPSIYIAKREIPLSPV